jgi:acylphosphatase
MIRATLKITGDVQEAGYRSFITKSARKMGLVGYAENIPDGIVEVVCEGKKELIEEFISKIKIKTETVDVEDIEAKYSGSTGEFDGKGFIVKIDDMAQEMFQGYATSLKYFKIGWSKQDKTTIAIKDMHQDLKGFREETKGEFQTIKTDYGKISQDLGGAVDSINRIAKSIETLAKAIVEKK